MDEIETLVAETYRHFNDHYQPETRHPSAEDDLFAEIPDGPGLLYHLQKSPSIFVIRTLVSQNIRDDYRMIIADPGNYPSLRLVGDESDDITSHLKFFSVESAPEAEIIHDQLNNRRFPVFEETLCNISDPGFSWWLTKVNGSFQLAFNLASQDETTVKLGPLGDQQLAVKNFGILADMFDHLGLDYSIQNEGTRIIFGDENALIQEEFQSIFEFGEMGEGLKNIFKIIARRYPDTSNIETCWYYLKEVAAVRRFWIQIQYDLTT